MSGHLEVGKFSGVLFLLLVFILFMPISASWWNSGYDYRKSVNITETSGQDLNNHQVKLEVNTADLISEGDLQESCKDLRFVGSDDSTSLDYWLESGCNTDSTTLWIELPQISANSEKRIYMYYGDSEASSASDGESTFPVFDGFNDGSLDDQWTDYNSGDVLTESNGRLEITTGNVYSASKDVSQPGTVVEAKLKYTSSIAGDHSGLMIADSGNMEGSNSNSNANILFISDDEQGTVSTWAGNGETTSYNICSGVSAFTATQGEDYIYGLADTGTEIKTYMNYDNKVSCAGDLTSQHSDFVIGLGHFSLNSDPSTTDTSYDWIRTRKHVSSDPQIEIGSEAQLNICDIRGPENECVLNSTRDISQKNFTVDSVFLSGSEASVTASEDFGEIRISNSSSFSGLWTGNIKLFAEEVVLEAGASFRPEDGRIIFRSN